jgi:pimeloyl-ACP methyl ester carboxylesterase
MKKTGYPILFAGIVFILCMAFWIIYLMQNVETRTMNEEARKNAGGKFALLSSGVTHYDEAGPDSGQTVILVHGFSVPYYIWDPVFDSLSARGFHVVRYDEYGRGFSDRPETEYNAGLYRRQLLELIQFLKPRGSVDLAGVSFGGPVTADFCANYPEMVGKLILVDPVYAFEKPFNSEGLENYFMAYHHEQQATGQLKDFLHPQRFPHWVNRYKVQMQFRGFRHALISTRTNYSEDSIISNYRKLGKSDLQILLIWGKQDHTVPYFYSDSLRRILFMAKFLPVEDAAHLPYMEQPSLVIPSMVRILKNN